ncbi:MAG TPA: MBL fold metallo-hydrolase [Blastocatellia bacterium]|nr:MBL fold metallo-hydrolase [Blastocatellia bacterium]
MATAKSKSAKKRAVNGSKKGAAKAAPARAASGQLNKNTIRVRMYRIGFGDCFLVSLPIRGEDSKSDYKHILVDCGVHGRGDIKTMEQAIDNIAKVTGKKLAVVIGSHAHQDHISGFGKFAEKFAEFDIDEVWLPWAMDKNNKVANRFVKKQAALVSQLEDHFHALAARGAPVENGALEAVENLRGNEKAIELLRMGFGVNATVRYMTAGDKLKDPARIQGLSVRVLGPPTSEEFLSQMDPPAGQHYLRLVNGNVEPADSAPIFANKWTAQANAIGVPRLSLDDMQTLKERAEFPLDDLAFALTKVTNNTSLVVLLVFRGQYLLFPGDAEYGNWRWWLEQDDSGDILSRISFYKVSHHGSFNGTPKSAVEKMSEGRFGAMVSTQSAPWKSIPKPELMTALNLRAQKRIVRSDWISVDSAPAPLPGSMPVEPPRLPKGFSKGSIWVDYFINL